MVLKKHTERFQKRSRRFLKNIPIFFEAYTPIYKNHRDEFVKWLFFIH